MDQTYHQLSRSEYNAPSLTNLEGTGGVFVGYMARDDGVKVLGQGGQGVLIPARATANTTPRSRSCFAICETVLARELQQQGVNGTVTTLNHKLLSSKQYDC